jgi:hypothetical protein
MSLFEPIIMANQLKIVIIVLGLVETIVGCANLQV